MALTIRTNHHDREFVYRWDVPDEVLADQFDYQDPEEATDGFFCYHGIWYHVDQFIRINDDEGPLADWDGSHNDSMCSGVLIKISDDGETYRVATFCS